MVNNRQLDAVQRASPGLCELFQKEPARFAVLPDDSPLRDLRWIVCVECGRAAYERQGVGCCKACRTRGAALDREMKRPHAARQYTRCSSCNEPIVGSDGLPLIGKEAKAATCTGCVLGGRPAGEPAAGLADPASVSGAPGNPCVENDAAGERAELSSRVIGTLRTFLGQVCGAFSGQRDCLAGVCGDCVVLKGSHCQRLLDEIAKKIGAAPETVCKVYPGEQLRTQALFYKGRRCRVCQAPVGKRKRFCPMCLRHRQREQSREAKRRQKASGSRPRLGPGRPKEDAA